MCRQIIKHPKGGMCANCEKIGQDCGSLDFESMQVISKAYVHGEKWFQVVRCCEFTKVEE